MTYLAVAILVSISGCCIVHIFKLSREHFVYDMALGWHIGSGYYCIFCAVLYFGTGLTLTVSYSIAIITLPILIIFLRLRKYLPAIISSVKNIRFTEYLPGNRLISLESLLLGYAFFAYILVFLHGTSTPIITDDALALRAYVPTLVYENYREYSIKNLILTNGMWSSFQPLIFWHVNGAIAHIFIKYTILTSLFCFLVVIYLAPTIRGQNRWGIYNIFLVMSLPLFLYHSTIAYADMMLAMSCAMGFMFFTFYTQSFNTKDLKSAILLFIIAFLIKDKGIIIFMTGMSFILAVFVHRTIRQKRIQNLTAMVIVIILLFASAILLIKIDANRFIIEWLEKAPNMLYAFLANGLLEPLRNSFVDGEPFMPSQYPYYVKLSSFLRSLFTSGNFGLTFYLLFATILLNIRRMFSFGSLWVFLLGSAIFFEVFVYMVIIYQNLDNHQDILHRTIIIPAVISSIYIPFLWTKFLPSWSAPVERENVTSSRRA